MPMRVKMLNGEIKNITTVQEFAQFHQKMKLQYSVYSVKGMGNKFKQLNMNAILSLANMSMLPRFFCSFEKDGEVVIPMKELAAFVGLTPESIWGVLGGHDLEIFEVPKDHGYAGDLIELKQNSAAPVLRVAGHDTVESDSDYLTKLFFETLPKLMNGVKLLVPVGNVISAKDLKTVRSVLYSIVHSAKGHEVNIKKIKALAFADKLHTASLSDASIDNEYLLSLLCACFPYSLKPEVDEIGGIIRGSTKNQVDPALLLYYAVLFIKGETPSWNNFPPVFEGKEITKFVKEWIAKQ